ncbi:PilW family protein [Motiliproteus sp. SC1-56]|uniref:PilW family protein n=1 Tax=Motiliproteus sp. SC1-56 TaxID=2799565 RepID=UPI001A8EF169|nr:type II secretion system protein [Motiliproteus sp. SC1-56]
MRASRGFTLIELIVVIVVMGIMAFGTVQFIVNSSQGYADAARRGRLGSTGAVAVEQLARELRNALPNSVRAGRSPNVGIPCLEYVPVLAGTHYLDIPVQSASSGFLSVPFMAPPAIGRVAVYPLQAADIYRLASVPGEPSVISAEKVITAPSDLVGTAAVRVGWGSSHAFPSASPTGRWFMVDEPVSFCVVGDKLFRYAGYGFHSVQPFPQESSAPLPAAVPQRRLLADALVLEGEPFRLIAATLQRNALVRLDLSFKAGDEGVRIQHEVQLRNVP